MRSIRCPLLGVEVGLPDRVERIVSLSPSLTDCVARLGLRDRLVGRSAWCWRPEEITGLPVVGTYTTVRREVLDRLEADLVLTTSGVQEPLARELARSGVPVFVVPLPVTPWGVLENLATVAELVGQPQSALGPLEQLHDALSELRSTCETRTVYAEIDLGEPITPGPGSHAFWALSWLGVSPLVPPGASAWSVPDPAWLETIRPQAIVYDPQPGASVSPETVRRRLTERGLDGWFDRDPQIVVTPGDVLAHYGPWFIERGLPDLARALDSRPA